MSAELLERSTAKGSTLPDIVRGLAERSMLGRAPVWLFARSDSTPPIHPGSSITLHVARAHTPNNNNNNPKKPRRRRQ